MTKKKNIDKTFISVAATHCVAIALISIAGFYTPVSKQEQEIQQVKAMPSQQVTTTVSAAEVNKTVEKLRQMRSDASQNEISQRQEIDDLKREAALRSKSAASKRAELSDISKQIEVEKNRLEVLKKKKIADLKRKQRLAVEKRARDMAEIAEKKASDQKKLKAIADEKKRADAAKAAEDQHLLKIITEKKAAEQQQAAALKRKNISDRANYEGEIYDRLFGTWALPYVRSNVKCSVKLNVAKDGRITGFEFMTPCPDMYKSSISTAINNISSFSIDNPSSYRPTEIVNFLDNLSNQSVG